MSNIKPLIHELIYCNKREIDRQELKIQELESSLVEANKQLNNFIQTKIELEYVVKSLNLGE